MGFEWKEISKGWVCLAQTLESSWLQLSFLVKALAPYLTDSEMWHLAAGIKGPSYFLSRKFDGMSRCDIQGYTCLGALGKALECLTILHMFLDVEVHEL